MTEKEVLRIASVFMDGRDLKGYIYSLHNPGHYKDNPELWKIVVYLADSDGAIFGGPAFITIDDITGTVLHYGQTRYVKDA